MTPIAVLDSFALLAFWRDEPGAEDVKHWLQRAEAGGARLVMSVINLGEALYLVERRHGSDQARHALAFVQEGPIQVYEASPARVLAAAHLKAHHPISYADAFAAALAEELEAVLLTGDSEFLTLEGRIAIQWLSARD